MLERFTKAAVETTTSYEAQKAANGPSVVHASGTTEFGSAREAIDRDLSHLLGSYPVRDISDVYSVHFSDLNGLSKLENNILAHEISSYLCEYEAKLIC
jgi:hypothetical protein